MTFQLHQLADAYMQQGRAEEALQVLRQILVMDPVDEKANYLLALQCYSRGQLDLAKKALKVVCQKDGAQYEPLYLLGSIFLEGGEYQQASEYFQRALIERDTHEVNFQLGFMCAALRRYETAIQFFEASLKKNPSSLESLINLGAALRNIGNFDLSLKYLNEAIAIDPNNADTWLNQGATLDSMGNLPAALVAYDRAIHLDGSYLEAYANKGNTALALGDLEGAHKSFQQALNIYPADADTLSNYSVLKLIEGDFRTGWEYYEARLNSTGKIFNPYQELAKLTSLEDAKDKRILVWSEQGLGDTIQFYRYLTMLGAYSQHITFVVQDELFELLSSQEANFQIAQFGKISVDHFDLQCPMMSLPHIFQTEPETIPAKIPYLFADPIKTKFWADKLSAHEGLKVGLVWSGGVKEDPNLWEMNKRRNISFAEYYRFSEIPNISFFNLQKGDGLKSLDYQNKNVFWKNQNFFDYSDELKNFSDTAALVKNLDLVISVDTSTAHLAGALGQNVWVLNRFDGCWRWRLKGRSDSPWYPTAKIYTQHEFQNWEKVMHEVQSDLSAAAKIKA